MKYTFSAELRAKIEISDSDFRLLLESSSRHYDHAVQSISMVGGFLYGYNNVRDFSNGENKTVGVTMREIGLMLKSLEGVATDKADFLGRHLYKIVEELAKKSEELNKVLAAEVHG